MRRRPCLECGKPSSGIRCLEHARARQALEDRRRNARPEHLARLTITSSQRRRVYARDGYRCRYCGEPATSSDPLTLDHVVPLAVELRFHPSDEELVTAHRSCNSRRGARVRRGGGHPPPRENGAALYPRDTSESESLAPLVS